MDKRNIMSRPRVVQQIRPKANLPSGSFIALGGRPNTPESIQASVSQIGGVGGLKRDAGPVTPSALGVVKKPRLGIREIGEGRPTAPPTTNIVGPTGRREAPTENLWQNASPDVTPANFPSKLAAAEEKGKAEKVVVGLTKVLYDHRTKAPDPSLSAHFCFLAREKPQYFRDSVVECLCVVLRRPTALKVPQKCHPLVYQLTCSTLVRALQTREEWPDVLVKVYLDDALTDRVWVDRKECQQLVQNILTAFGTEQPPPEFFVYLHYGEGSRPSIDRAGGASPGHAGASPLYDDDSRSRDGPDTRMEEDASAGESGGSATTSGGGGGFTQATPPARFNKSADAIRSYTIEILRDWWARRLDSVPKSLVKTMAATCGYPEVRLAAAQKLDAWLQNAKLQRVAAELMMAVCVNFKESTDMEALSSLTRLRFKSRVIGNNYCYVLKELFARVPSSLPLVLKLVVHNELSPTARAPHNMLTIGQCFQFNSEISSQTLANICFELLSSTREDYSRSLRAFLREVVRSALKFDFPMNAFCQALTQERPVAPLADHAIRDRVFHAIEDFLCLAAFMAVSPPLRDAALAVGRGDRREISLVNAYQQNVRHMQHDAIVWMHTTVPGMFRASKDDYGRCLYRITFLEKPESFYSKDGWPTDQERNLYMKIIAESGVGEDTLLRILTIGLSADNALSPAAALEVTEQLVRRTALAMVDPKFSVADPAILKIKDLHIVDLLFNCCRYRPPDSYQLPSNYALPMLAISKSFWVATNVLLILAAHNPTVIGKFVWENYPTLHYMMEMVISEDYSFPPVTSVTEMHPADLIKQQDLQMAELEKQEILQLEGYLANETITENNSSLLAHLMRLEPKGVPRRPSPYALDTLRLLNQQMNLGLTFCRSRDPDFLLEIINRQGSSHSLPWLIQLIQKNEGSLRLLPVQCLCEFLLHHLETEQRPADESAGASSSRFLEVHNSQELRQRLVDVVWEQAADSIHAENTLMYFFNRLQADTEHDRRMAICALEILLKSSDTDQSTSAETGKSRFQWLLTGLPSIPHFTSIRIKIVSVLSKCVLVETNLDVLRGYIAFMESHLTEEELDDVALNLGKLIYCRRALTERLLTGNRDGKTEPFQTLNRLLNVFDKHLKHVQSTQSEVISWSASQDQLLIQWGEAASAIMNVNVVAATLLLLGYPPPEGSTTYDHLMENWFPAEVKPCAYMIDTSEEAELIPEDVRFQLIRSNNSRLVDYVLQTMDDRQLLTCIEYSGLPPETISEVCTMLDTMVMKNTTLLDDMKFRASTWIGFLLSHRTRGANIGEKFIEWCQKSAADGKDGKIEPMDTSFTAPMSTPIETQVSILDIKDTKLVDKQLAAVFYEETSLAREFSQILTGISSVDGYVKVVLGWLDKELKRDATKLVDGMNRKKKQTSCLFRVLESQVQIDQENAGNFSTVCSRLRTHSDRLDEVIAPVIKKGQKHEEMEEKMDVQCSANEMDDTQTRNAILELLEKLRERNCDSEKSAVDQVLRLDPEIVRMVPWEQLQYLFGPSNAVGLRHILSLLPHWGNVDTLRSVVEKLLAHPSKTFDSKKVLDFIDAVIELPRLWAGREPKLPRHYQRENILHLTQPQLETLLHYVIMELSTMPISAIRCDCSPTQPVQAATSKSKMEWKPHGPFSNGDGVSASSMEGRMKERLKLVLECCKDCYRPVVRWLAVAPANGYEKEIVNIFLLELYFARPEISKYLPSGNMLADVRCMIHSGYTNLDALLYRLLTASARCADDKIYEQELEQLDAKLSELASSHPTILIRHTPLIAASLRGTIAFSMRKYDKTNYLEWYDMLLNLLDKLRPAIFDVHYSNALLDMLGSFFDFIQNHGLRGGKQVPLMEKILKFVCHFHDGRQDLASHFLQSHSTLIQAIIARFPDLASVREIKKICC